MTTLNVNLWEGMLFYWDPNWNQMGQNESILYELSPNEKEEMDWSYLMRGIFELASLETDLSHQMDNSSFKYCFFNVEELNTEPTITCQEIALTIFNTPFSYFSQDPQEFLRAGAGDKSHCMAIKDCD